MSDEISSSVLFHCWREDDPISARLTLESICSKGLLLTTNTETLDTFQIDRGSGIVPMEVMQHARVCFTDIPLDRLHHHGRRYGRYGVGFLRESIIEWGGLPVWYLPNFWSETSLKVAGPVLVNALHGAIDAVNQFRALAQDLCSRGIPFSVTYEHGPTLNARQLTAEMEQVAQALFMVLSFVKEMSPPSLEDHSYLFEREWRLMSGFTRAGNEAAFRALTREEKESLCSRRPRWSEPRRSVDSNIAWRFGASAVVDDFLFFNGLVNTGTVAECLDTILVPDEAEANWASTFINEHRSEFGEQTPRILVFPSS